MQNVCQSCCQKEDKDVFYTMHDLECYTINWHGYKRTYWLCGRCAERACEAFDDAVRPPAKGGN